MITEITAEFTFKPGGACIDDNNKTIEWPYGEEAESPNPVLIVWHTRNITIGKLDKLGWLFVKAYADINDVANSVAHKFYRIHPDHPTHALIDLLDPMKVL